MTLPFTRTSWRLARVTAEIEHRLSGGGSVVWFVYVDGDIVIRESFSKTVAEAQEEIRMRWGVEPLVTVRKAYVKKPKPVKP
jgi:hypothetical protein